MLRIENLHAGYGGLAVLHGITMQVPPGKIVCIIGANGSGKSTIFKAIFGLVRAAPHSRVSFNGTNLTNSKPNQVVRHGISYVPQGRSIFRNLTVEENLRMGAYVRNDADVWRDIDYIYELFPALRARQHINAANLSGGEQQMLVMGRALLLNPKLVLLDEPSLGLEPRFTELVFDRVREINRSGKAIFIIEQNAQRALEIANYAYVLDLGQVQFEGPPAEILANGEVQKLYLGG
jgi:ABC-type branched-subunit amino acid transport system ATPase component